MRGKETRKMRWETFVGATTGRQDPAPTRNTPGGSKCPALPIVMPIQERPCGPTLPQNWGTIDAQHSSLSSQRSCHGSRRDSPCWQQPWEGVLPAVEGRQPAALVLSPAAAGSLGQPLLIVPWSCRSPSPFSPCDVSVCDFLSFNQFSSQ